MHLAGDLHFYMRHSFASEKEVKPAEGPMYREEEEGFTVGDDSRGGEAATGPPRSPSPAPSLWAISAASAAAPAASERDSQDHHHDGSSDSVTEQLKGASVCDVALGVDRGVERRVLIPPPSHLGTPRQRDDFFGGQSPSEGADRLHHDQSSLSLNGGSDDDDEGGGGGECERAVGVAAGRRAMRRIHSRRRLNAAGSSPPAAAAGSSFSPLSSAAAVHVTRSSRAVLPAGLIAQELGLTSALRPVKHPSAPCAACQAR